MNAIVRPLFKYWPLVLGLALVTSVLAGMEREPSFESRARLLVKLGDEFLQSDLDPGSRSSGRILLAEAVNTDVQILTSYDQYEKVVQELGADSFRPPESVSVDFDLESAVESLRRGINVKSVENSAVIHLTYENPDPERARLVLRTLIDVYLRERGKILGSGNISVLEDVRQEAYEAFVDTREAHDASLDGNSVKDMETTLGLLREQLMALGAESRDTRRELLESESRLAAIDAEIARQPARTEIYSEPRANTALESARNRLVELRVEEKQLLGKYTEGSRPVTRARSEMAELERIIRSEEQAGGPAVSRTGNNPIRDGLELSKTELAVGIVGARTRLEALAEQQAELRDELAALEGRYVVAQRLGDALAVAESRYRELDQQYLERRIWTDTAAVREASIRIIERPSLPTGTIGLPASVRYTLGAVIGFLAGWILAVWIELLRTSPRSSGTPRPSGDTFEPNELTRDRRYRGHLPDRRSPYQNSLPVLGEFRPVEAAGKGR